MRRLTAVLVLVLMTACGGEGDDDFVTWATEQGGLDQETAECVEPKLSEAERDALVSVEEDTSEDDIDAQAVDALVAASADC